MPPSLAECPNEIIETILVLLDLDDVRTLRLSCRSLSISCVQAHFKSYYHTKRVEISSRGLKAFVDAMQHNRFVYCLQKLILVGLTAGGQRARSKQTREIAEIEANLLSQAFRGIAASMNQGELLSICLEVAIGIKSRRERAPPSTCPRYKWLSVWQCTAQTFHTTMRALSASALPLGELRLYHGSNMRFCSLASNELGKVDFGERGLASSLSSLTSLSISLSDAVVDNLAGELLAGREQAACASDGLAGLLQPAVSLANLEIHWFRLRNPLGRADNPLRSRCLLLSATAQLGLLPKLKSCKLDGVYTIERDLLAFVQHTAVQRLTLERVSLLSGTFRSSFEYCVSEDAKMQTLYFNDLFECDALLEFQSLLLLGGQSPPTMTTTRLSRHGREITQPVNYHCQWTYALEPDSPHTRMRAQRIRANYGPP
ncbi:hypothetical protein MMC25_004161 [Agyrium rufum]|nr:hypothetical protein [Agyrium rufum]